MKKAFFYTLFAMVVFWIFQASITADTMSADEYSEFYDSDRSLYVSLSDGADTITNTEADTVYVLSALFMDGFVDYHITTTSLSGTDDITAKLEISNDANATATTGDWVSSGLSSVQATADGTIRLTLTPIYGVKHRLVLTGAGTQSTTYDISGLLKY